MLDHKIPARRITESAGFRESAPDPDNKGDEVEIFYVYPQVFRNEVCKGFDHKMVEPPYQS